jgi:anti-sigma B factor antagonist
MKMNASMREVNGVTILDLAGRITLGAGSLILRDIVRDLLGKGHKAILLNLAGINYIDSSGVGELVGAYTTARRDGGQLKLVGLTKKVQDLMKMTKLYTVFDVKEDEAAAIRSFKPHS